MAITAGAAAGCALPDQNQPGAARAADDAHHQAWEMASTIRKQTIVPVFPDKSFPITDFGAVADGKTDASDAFAKAIAACHNAGGGTVIVPAGRFVTGVIHLKSNVNLHLHDDAHILFITDPKAYLPPVLTRWEGVEL